MLIALLVFLVLRQVMPIASGLAGGASLNSFGLPGRNVSWAARTAAKVASPYIRSAGGYVGRGTGRLVRGAAAYSGRYMYRRAGAGVIGADK
jgi:hypothetical protein